LTVRTSPEPSLLNKVKKGALTGFAIPPVTARGLSPAPLVMRFPARHPTTRGNRPPRPRPYPWGPTLGGLDARQRRVRCIDTRRALPPRPRVKGVPAPDNPDQPCAGWIRASAMPRWTGSQGRRPRHPRAGAPPLHPAP
jgi:hypothetical protein